MITYSSDQTDSGVGRTTHKVNREEHLKPEEQAEKIGSGLHVQSHEDAARHASEALNIKKVRKPSNR